MKPESLKKRKFGDVEVGWNCNLAEVSCDVDLYWRGNLLVKKTLYRQGQEPEQRLPFSARCDSATSPGVSGVLVLTFDSAGLHRLELELRHDGHPPQRHRLWPHREEPACEPGPEPARDEPIATDDTIALDSDGCMETTLFPYLYLRKWHGIGPQQKQDRFLVYEPGPDAAPPRFYDELLAAGAGRATLATEYIERAAPFDGPGQWIGGLDDLPAPFAHFARCHEALVARGEPCCGELPYWWFWEELERHTGLAYCDLRLAVMAPAFAATLDRCWLAVFALLLVASDRTALLDALIRTIIIGHLLRRTCALMAPGDPDEACQPLPGQEHPYWTRRRVGEGVAATLVLPAKLFVLPSGVAPVLPYAIGELQLVRQRLARYALGEVSRIDNVMKGEAIETTRRQLQRTSHSSSDSGSLDSASEAVLVNTQVDYFDEAYKTLAEAFKFTRGTTYGPPSGDTPPLPAGSQETATLEPLDSHPRAKTLERAARVARDVTSRTASQLARRAEWARASSSLLENEETVVNRIDGSRYERHVRGIHRWVDKIYRAHVVNYGHRLILELNIGDPASTYVAREQQLHGMALGRPTSLHEFGVNIFPDILDEDGHSNSYTSLIQYYGSTDVTLPPQRNMIVNASFQAGMTVSCQDIAVPEGYQVTSATISVNWSPGCGITAIYGLLGTQRYHFPVKADQVPAATTTTLDFVPPCDAATLPFSIACARTPATPSLPNERAPLMCMASVSLALVPTPAARHRWQFAFYKAMEAAYSRRLQAYAQASGSHDAAGGGSPGHNPLACQHAVRQTLRERISAVLVQQASQLRSAAVGLPAAGYRDFPDQAFEWQEMAYSFDPGTAGAAELADSNELLPAFLNARSARVLLPVRPDYAFLVPYWLSCGQAWHGAPALTPVYEQSAAAQGAVNELKSCMHGGNQPHPCGRPWEIRVPTAMTVLQHGDELPVFGGEGACSRMAL